jgi:hypothetical protein
MPNTGQYSQLTANVTIQLTQDHTGGKDNLSDNFTVDIYSWDTGSTSPIFDRTYISGLTKTDISTVNGGSLTVSPYYELTGITPNDYYIKTTASGPCSYSTTTDIVPAAITVYNPSSAVITPQTALGIDVDIQYNTPSGTQTTAHSVHIADFTMLPFGQLGAYATYDVTGFSVSHVYTQYQSDNATVNGQFANGPLQTPVFSLSVINTDGQHFELKGNQISGLTDKPGQCVTRYKVTWDASGNFTYVDLYWYAAGNV